MSLEVSLVEMNEWQKGYESEQEREIERDMKKDMFLLLYDVM